MRGGLRRFARNRMALLGAFVIACVCVLTVAAPFLYPAGAFSLAGPPLQPPGARFLLGTDALGRDVAAGLVEGARTSLLIGIAAALGAVMLGATIGGVAGYYRGAADIVLMRITEFFQTIPAFLLAMLLVVILSPSVASVIIAITAVSWPGIARLVRGEFVALGGREFIMASAGLGASGPRIIFRHLLPNCLSSIIAVGSLLVATAILLETGLAFLGLGDPNVMSWGLQISAGRVSLRSAWWICTFPGIAILLTVLSINLIGDGLNEALNPRLRER
ncbi:MAG TPA: ABC transporter permease [Roseomonas sp.]|jgi:peptide/nickel transport system permease protein